MGKIEIKVQVSAARVALFSFLFSMIVTVTAAWAPWPWALLGFAGAGFFLAGAFLNVASDAAKRTIMANLDVLTHVDRAV